MAGRLFENSFSYEFVYVHDPNQYALHHALELRESGGGGDDGTRGLLGAGASGGWHLSWYRLDGSNCPVLVAVVASICPGDLNVTSLHDPSG